MQTHRYSFFGQKTALVLQSGNWTAPCIFLTFIKKRDNGTWERLAEGKTVKLSLPEIIAVRDVAAGEHPEWKTYHKSNGNGTSIAARLEKNKADSTLLLAVGDYLKPVNYPETTVFKELLDHVLKEKITHAPGATKPNQDEPNPPEQHSPT